MTLKYYHAEPAANSLKSMIPLIEKSLPYESIYVDLHKFEQHEPWFVAINPEGQVPVLDHDGAIVTHTTVINEYLEDVFPEVPLRPRDPVGAARVRYWNKFCDEQVMNYVSIHGWHRMVSIIARSIESGEFERLMARIPLPDQRRKWRAARRVRAARPRGCGPGRGKRDERRREDARVAAAGGVHVRRTARADRAAEARPGAGGGSRARARQLPQLP